MMDVANWAVGGALLLGTLRALSLWRAQTKVEVVNVVVLSALGEGRGSDLPAVLRRSGAALYLEVAARIVEPVEKLFGDDTGALKKRLERDALKALAHANARLKQYWWMDTLVIAAIAVTGFSAFSGRTPSVVLTGELLAATLLWLANVRGARNASTRVYAGAMALVESLVAAAAELREARESPADKSE
jgi:hypothetical protein